MPKLWCLNSTWTCLSYSEKFAHSRSQYLPSLWEGKITSQDTVEYWRGKECILKFSYLKKILRCTIIPSQSVLLTRTEGPQFPQASRDGSKGMWLGGGGGAKANLTNSRRSTLRFDRLESVNVEVWPTPVGQCWGLTDSSRSMLRFDRLESVNVEVWPARVGQCWGLTDLSRSMLRYGQLESVNTEVWLARVGQCWGLTNSNCFIKQNISVGHFWWSNSVRDWPTQPGFDQLSQQHCGGGDPPPPFGAIPAGISLSLKSQRP